MPPALDLLVREAAFAHVQACAERRDGTVTRAELEGLVVYRRGSR